MNRNKYLLLSSSLGVLLLLIVAAVQENFRSPWRAVQAAGRNEQGAIPVQLRQIANPKLAITDRCATCHVSMGPGEKGVTGAKIFAPHPSVVHDPAEYGCTVCHGGQGLATTKEDAHGDVHFWPEPMIPRAMAQAGCGTCHSPLHTPTRSVLAKARLTFERLDCRTCHRVDGRGGTIRPGGGGMEGPDLSRTGLVGYDKDWYAKHLEKSGKASSGPWRDAFAAVSEQDRSQVALYLSTRMAAPELVEAKATFHSFGCLGCHRVSGVGGDEGPDLTRAGEKDPGQVDFAHVPEGAGLRNWIGEHFRSPGAVVPGSQMPMVAASRRELDQLTMYVLSLRRRDLPAAYVPKDRMRAVRFGDREFAADGATIFGAFCAGCHGADGLGRNAPDGTAFPAIASPDFLSRVPDKFLSETVRAGRPGRRMPAWSKDGGLRPEEIRAVVEYVRELGGADAAPGFDAEWKNDGEPARGEPLYASACAGCHGPKGQGGKGPALANKVLLENATDFYFRETIKRGRRGTAMPGFAESSPARRTLADGEIEALIAYIRSW